MHGRKTRVLAKKYLDQGLSKVAVSRRLGVHRRTLHRWINLEQWQRSPEETARYGPRPHRAHKLDAYKGIIDAILAARPETSARKLHEEVRKAGYAGGYGRVRDHVRSIRA